MDAKKLKEIEAESGFPEGIAARIESVDLRRLLAERLELIDALEHLAPHALCFVKNTQKAPADDGRSGPCPCVVCFDARAALEVLDSVTK